MKFIKRSQRKSPKVSLVLLDWSVRESLHLLHYLEKQTVPRDDFEVTLIEFYDRVADVVRKFEGQLDNWIVMQMPKRCYYHKHLMYNVGIVISRGDIITICDSDAMAKETFIESIVANFARDRKTAYHMDQFRNMRRDFYPFNYPQFEDVVGDGCTNFKDGVTTGVLNTEDPVHSRNYGACMSACRSDLIAIGGADEHMDYLGHICGPYELTFRLANIGWREVWDMKEFLYHTWHPGQAGADNYLGPHDGRHMSSTALEVRNSGRVFPLLENRAIRMLRDGGAKRAEDVLDLLVDDDYVRIWDIEAIEKGSTHARWTDYKAPICVYKGYVLTAEVDRVFAFPVTDKKERDGQGHVAPFEGADVDETKHRIDAATPGGLLIASRVAWLYVLTFHLLRGSGFASGVRGLLRSIEDPSDRLSHLAISIHNLHKFGDLAKNGERPLVLTESFYTILFLHLLRAFGMVPGHDALRITDSGSLQTHLKGLVEKGARGRLVISRQMYERYQGIMLQLVEASRIIVV